MELQDYLQIIRRRLWILLSMPMIAGLTAGLLSYFVLPPTYEAAATVWVVKQDRTPPTMSDLMFNRSLVRTYGEIATGRRVLEQVIIDLNLEEEVPLLQERVTVSGVDGTEVMKITVADSNAERAAEIANAVAQAFSNEIRQFMQLENVRLVEEALPPAHPVRPNKSRNLLIGLGLGAGAAGGLVLLLEGLDLSIKGAKDVERHLQLRVLGTVPAFRRRKSRGAEGKK
jgi:capsular polysaccharide biosynthesis protein